MNPLIIFFVRDSATQREVESALRNHFSFQENCENQPPDTVRTEGELPLWTWFIPNPRPTRRSFNAESGTG